MRFMVLAKWLRILRKSSYFLKSQLHICWNSLIRLYSLNFSLTSIPIIEFITIHFGVSFKVISFRVRVKSQKNAHGRFSTKKWQLFLLNLIWFILMILLYSANTRFPIWLEATSDKFIEKSKSFVVEFNRIHFMNRHNLKSTYIPPKCSLAPPSLKISSWQ